MRTACWLAGLSVLVAAACSPPNGVDYTGGGDSAGGGGACPSYSPATCPPGTPGYKATIGPIVSELCADCHAPGGLASNLPLATYAEVSGAAGSVLFAVSGCSMPPPGSEALTLAQRKDLIAWLVCGAPDN